MINMQMLDVAIGIVFIYFLLSLVCSALKEWVAHLLKWRSVHLEQGIIDLLRHSGDKGIGKDFIAHPMIQGLCDEKDKVSHIPARTFSLVLLDLITSGDGKEGDMTSLRETITALDKDSDLRRNLLILYDDAQNSIEKFKKNIETWFDHSMDRVTTIYQRSARKIIIIIAFLVAAVANADTLELADELANNPVLRGSVARQAEQHMNIQGLSADNDTASEQIEQIQEHIQTLGVPLGWETLPEGIAGWLNKILGITITAFAISLGAPFWFDLISKISAIKSSGRQKVTVLASKK